MLSTKNVKIKMSHLIKPSVGTADNIPATPHHSPVHPVVAAGHPCSPHREGAAILQRTRSSISAVNMPEARSSLLSSPSSRRSLTVSQMLLLNSVVMGTEFCAAAAFTYIPPLLLKAGLGEKYMSIVLGIGPLLGFLIVPMIGRASDQCRSKYGRRRPFILLLGCILIASLLIIPYGEVAGMYIGGEHFSKQIGVGLLIFGSILLDFSSQACLTPCEALLSDASKNTNQKDRCFTIYSLMVSIGGCVGYLIGALDWKASSVGAYLGSQEKSAFTILIVLFLITMFATLAVAEETPLDQIQAEERERRNMPENTLKHADGSSFQDPGYETDSDQSNCGVEASPLLVARQPDETDEDASPGVTPALFRRSQWRLPCTKLTFTTLQGLGYLICIRLYKILPRSIKALFHIPFVLQRLAIANFFSWTAVMGFNLFFTDYVGQAIYSGNPNAAEDSHERALYDEGVRMGSWGLLLHCIVSAVYAGVIDRVAQKYSYYRMYMFGMSTFTVAVLLLVFTRHFIFVNIVAMMTGLGYATVTTIPFMLITQYHENKDVYFCDNVNSAGTVSARGIGTDIATVDSAYFGSQVFLSCFMGYFVWLTGTVVTYMVCAGIMGAVSVWEISHIVYDRQQMMSRVQLRGRNKSNIINRSVHHPYTAPLITS